MLTKGLSNIIVGMTVMGKTTTFSKALADIRPTDHNRITIEEISELVPVSTETGLIE